MRVFIYPESYTKTGRVEESFQDEFEAMEDEGFELYIFNTMELKDVDFSFCDGKEVIYRGWHLKLEEYKELLERIESFGGKLISNLSQYKNGRYMSEWVDLIEKLTPKTHFFKNNSAAFEFVSHHDHHKYFVKDQVKSLKDVASSNIISHREELESWVQEVEYFNGSLEGGICLREAEDFQEDTEMRFFVMDGAVYSKDNSTIVPEIVTDVASKIELPFYSVDIILNSDNEWRVVEITDGQVSQSSTWEMEDFVKIFN